MWQPNCDIRFLKKRAQMNKTIRAFFDTRGMMEVETPALSQAATTDIHIQSFQTLESRYLHTSPEFPMKRLLCAGSDDIYQICKVFRQGEAGRYHNPEFTMLEWYRLGFDMPALMNEVNELMHTLNEVAGLSNNPSSDLTQDSTFFTYAAIFEKVTRLPLSAPLESYKTCAIENNIHIEAELTRDEWLDLLFSEVVAKTFPEDALTFIYDYPESQAALAQIKGEVAKRFEVYWGALELGNGFQELQDAKEQRMRFEQDNIVRAKQHRVVPIDTNFIAALKHGLPACSGVAIGLDRLLMRLTGASQIDEVLSFDWSRA